MTLGAAVSIRLAGVPGCGQAHVTKQLIALGTLTPETALLTATRGN